MLVEQPVDLAREIPTAILHLLLQSARRHGGLRQGASVSAPDTVIVEHAPSPAQSSQIFIAADVTLRYLHLSFLQTKTHNRLQIIGVNNLNNINNLKHFKHFNNHNNLNHHKKSQQTLNNLINLINLNLAKY